MDASEFFKGTGLRLSKSFLTFFIMLAISTYAFSHVTSPDFLKPVLNDFVAQQLETMPEGNSYTSRLNECNRPNTQRVYYYLSQFDDELVIECTELREAGPEGFNGLIAGKITDIIFESAYDSEICSGADCFSVALQNPDPFQKLAAMMNANFNAFMRNLSWLFMGLAVLCIALIITLAEGWPKKLFGVGVPLAFAGVPYFFMGAFQAQLEMTLPARALFAISGLIGVLSKAFLAMIVAGAVLIVLGIVIKIRSKNKTSSSNKKKK